MNGLATLAGDIPLRDYLLLALMLALLTAALGFTVKGAAARREERLERRLRLFREDPAAAGSSFPLLPIDFEKPESDTPKETAERPGGVRALSLLIRRQPLPRRMIRAGINPKQGGPIYRMLRLLLIALASLVTAALLAREGMATLFSLDGVLLVVAAGAGAALLPSSLLNARIRSRQQRIEQAVPDMIDLMILCIEAGLTLDAAMARAIDGLKPFAPDVAAEMRITLNELRILPDKAMALDNLEKRTASRSLKYLVLSLRQSERYGTSVSGALKAVAAEMRKVTQLELENAAARMPALLSVPLILLILPPVVALAAGPGFVLMMRAIGG